MSVFSIIIPTYNRANLLIRAVKSCIAQTFQDFEIIVVDDGSIDNTRDVIDSINDPRIIRRSLPCNRGCNAARNQGLDLAQGEYIVFLDSDDELLPGALEIFLSLWSGVTDKRIGNIVTRLIDSKTLQKIGYLEKEDMVLEYQDIVCRTKARGDFKSCWKRKAIGDERFDEELSGQESVTWSRLAKKWSFWYKDIPTGTYYRGLHSQVTSIDSTIRNAANMARGAEILLEEHGETLRAHCLSQYLIKLNSAVLFNLLSNNKKKTRYWCFVIFKQASFSFRILFLFFLSFLPFSIGVTALRLCLRGKYGTVAKRPNFPKSSIFISRR